MADDIKTHARSFHKVTQICAAPPGWFAVFKSGDGARERPLACWAIATKVTEYQDVKTEQVVTTKEEPGHTVGIAPTGDGCLWPAEDEGEFLGYRRSDAHADLKAWLKAHGHDGLPTPSMERTKKLSAQ